MQAGQVPVVLFAKQFDADTGVDVAEPGSVVVIALIPLPLPGLGTPVAPVREADKILGHLLADRNHDGDVFERYLALAANRQVAIDRAVEPKLASDGHRQRAARRPGRLNHAGRVLLFHPTLGPVEDQRLIGGPQDVNPNRRSQHVNPAAADFLRKTQVAQMQCTVEDFNRCTLPLDGGKRPRQQAIIQSPCRVQPSQSGMPPRLVIAVIGNDRTVHRELEANRLCMPVVDPDLHFATKIALGIVRDHHAYPERSNHALAKRKVLREVVATDVRAFQVEASDLIGPNGDLSRGVLQIGILQTQSLDIFFGRMDADLPAVVFTGLTDALERIPRAVKSPFLRDEVRHDDRSGPVFGKEQNWVWIAGQQVGKLAFGGDNLHGKERVHVRTFALAPPRLHSHQPSLGQKIESGIRKRGRVLHARTAFGGLRIEDDLAGAVCDDNLAHPDTGPVIPRIEPEGRRRTPGYSLVRRILGREQGRGERPAVIADTLDLRSDHRLVRQDLHGHGSGQREVHVHRPG